MSFGLKFSRLLLIIFIALLFLGQLTKINLAVFSGGIYLNDFVLLTLVISFLLYFSFERRKIILPVGFFPLMLFNFAALISLIYSLRMFGASEFFVGFLFWLRWVLYGLLLLIVPNLLTKRDLSFFNGLLIGAGTVIAVLGFLQILIFSNLTFLAAYGYDPHVKRLASTFFDPNYAGIFLNLILLNLLIGGQAVRKYNLLLISIIFTAIILTFSRSAYLALFASISAFGLLFSKRLAISLLILFVIASFFVPRVQERIKGAVSLDVTASARIESWKNAIEISRDNFLFGVGFNTYRFAQAKYGFFDVNQPQGGHSGAGSDSSLLTTLATTGIFGFGFLIIFLTCLTRFLIAKFKQNKFARISLLSLISLGIGSQFVNAFYYPWIIAVIWLTIGFANIDSDAKK